VNGLVRPGARGRSNRIILSMALVAILVAILAYLAVSIAAASQITQPYHAALSASAAGPVADFENVGFLSRVDHLHLKGWLFEVATRPNLHSAMIVHGHDANRVNPDWGALAMTKDLMSQGMDVLLFDLRGVGESEGDHQTFGTLEPRDVLGAYDFMVARGYPPEGMLIIGISTGGDTLLEAAPDLPRAGALVVDSAPSDTRSLLEPRVHERLPALFDPGIFAAAGVLFGLDIELRPVNRVKQLRERAFLFIVCDADDYVSPQNSVRLWRASSNPDSQLVQIHCRKHVSTYKTDRTSYLAALSAFTDRQIHERGG
jgi:uncharacterized protein